MALPGPLRVAAFVYDGARCAGDLGRPVLAVVGDHGDHEAIARVSLRIQGRDHVCDVAFLVVCGDEDREPGCWTSEGSILRQFARSRRRGKQDEQVRNAQRVDGGERRQCDSRWR